ncbi:hypothetical protein PP175_09040 [Aneurinibacillus sp. Ricciae_BoGa-3]|uniref:hypothetical protein n=1 Tax=Aneurinibacillus sp. Ricciae_BoGa-3 TaxID=3022697 RepID=UPI002340EABF|nr:hypothetical protein [Aneurinibacillus sp. Ricciae_BoGa-3]WCK56032.1 hypothetical protein PP175_09040 [Aneurinibacillus sp. Ricciae_BoGa-3]
METLHAKQRVIKLIIVGCRLLWILRIQFDHINKKRNGEQMEKNEQRLLDMDSDRNEDSNREELLDESLETFIEEKIGKRNF